MPSPFVIVGIGKSGTAAKNLLLAQGEDPSIIFTFDERNPAAQFTNWANLNGLATGTLVVSPGVPLQSPEIKNLVQKGWKLTSEINLAQRHLTSEIIVGITGSVGKSTVTCLIGEAMQADDGATFVGGNLGTPLAQYGVDLLAGKKRAKYIALELSSYQLENCSELRLDYSVITFLSANHLERYSSKEEYYQTKCSIGRLTKNSCVINGSSADLVRFKSRIPCPVTEVQFGAHEKSSLLSRTPLLGDHNKDNVAMAKVICDLLNLGPQAIDRMLHYAGLPHRLETLGKFNDILFINDSKATAMDSVLVAVRAAAAKTNAEGHLFVLIGGKDKNLPWENLGEIIRITERARPIFFGQYGAEAQGKSKLSGPIFSKLGQALDYLFQNVRPRDVALLSPGGTSLDEFKNFEERGDFFRERVTTYYSSK